MLGPPEKYILSSGLLKILGILFIIPINPKVLLNEKNHSLVLVARIALKKSNKYVLVSLPNEDYIISRIRFVFGKGIMTHGLEMVNTKPGHKHQWFIQYKINY